ncbi:MAG: hypothetical protein CMM50_05655 [Rhodospirillaceae bacterium]|nr:hypothetical protein [Rhodospirillaceae bacterium]
MKKILTFAAAALFALTGVAVAEPTDITVRVMSKDAKFVGTSMGGVRITIADADTGEILAEGLTAGTTGDTELLMLQDKTRRVPFATEDAAAYTATLDLVEPRRIRVSASGPLGQRQAINTVTSEQWVVPGRSITGGDAWLLELPGFAVDVLAPPSHVRIGGLPTPVAITANVTMMCGCPIEPGGLWDADKFEVKALIKLNGRSVGALPMKFAGETSQFAGTLDVKVPGVYEATVYAYDPSNGNTGVDKTTFIASN